MTDVAIIIAAWNAEAFIAGAVRSALAQTGVSLEVIVIDDASSDKTLEAARLAAKGDPRLICERLDENAGPSGARNRALEIADARYFAVLDADDAMRAGRLAEMVALADESGADIIVDNMVRVGAPGGEPDSPPFLDGPEAGAPADVSLETYVDPLSVRRFGGGLGFLKPLFRMRTVREADLRYDLSLRNSEDYFFVAELLAGGAEMRYAPRPGYYYTVRDGSLSHRLNPALTSAILSAETAFQARWRANAAPGLQAAFARRMAQLRRMDAFESLVEALKARHPVRVLGVLVSRIKQAPFMLGRLAAIALAKLSGRADPLSR